MYRSRFATLKVAVALCLTIASVQAASPPQSSRCHYYCVYGHVAYCCDDGSLASKYEGREKRATDDGETLTNTRRDLHYSSFDGLKLGSKKSRRYKRSNFHTERVNHERKPRNILLDWIFPTKTKQSTAKSRLSSSNYRMEISQNRKNLRTPHFTSRPKNNLLNIETLMKTGNTAPHLVKTAEIVGAPHVNIVNSNLSPKNPSKTYRINHNHGARNHLLKTNAGAIKQLNKHRIPMKTPPRSFMGRNPVSQKQVPNVYVGTPKTTSLLVTKPPAKTRTSGMDHGAALGAQLLSSALQPSSLNRDKRHDDKYYHPFYHSDTDITYIHYNPFRNYPGLANGYKHMSKLFFDSFKHVSGYDGPRAMLKGWWKNLNKRYRQYRENHDSSAVVHISNQVPHDNKIEDINLNVLLDDGFLKYIEKDLGSPGVMDEIVHHYQKLNKPKISYGPTKTIVNVITDYRDSKEPKPHVSSDMPIKIGYQDNTQTVSKKNVGMQGAHSKKFNTKLRPGETMSEYLNRMDELKNKGLKEKTILENDMKPLHPGKKAKNVFNGKKTETYFDEPFIEGSTKRTSFAVFEKGVMTKSNHHDDLGSQNQGNFGGYQENAQHNHEKIRRLDNDIIMTDNKKYEIITPDSGRVVEPENSDEDQMQTKIANLVLNLPSLCPCLNDDDSQATKFGLAQCHCPPLKELANIYEEYKLEYNVDEIDKDQFLQLYKAKLMPWYNRYSGIKP